MLTTKGLKDRKTTINKKVRTTEKDNIININAKSNILEASNSKIKDYKSLITFSHYNRGCNNLASMLKEWKEGEVSNKIISINRNTK